MTIVYLASFIGGLLLAVGVMIFGVERPRALHPNGERSFRLSPAPIGVCAVVFGVVGYVLLRRQAAGTLTTAVIAGIAGLIAAGITVRLVAQWWSVTPEHEVDDERYILQGHLARVTKSIDPGVDGEVVFEVEGEQRVLAARNFEAGSVAAGSDVVIERIEDDIAYVEAWQEVEKRL